MLITFARSEPSAFGIELALCCFRFGSHTTLGQAILEGFFSEAKGGKKTWCLKRLKRFFLFFFKKNMFFICLA